MVLTSHCSRLKELLTSTSRRSRKNPGTIWSEQFCACDRFTGKWLGQYSGTHAPSGRILPDRICARSRNIPHAEAAVVELCLIAARRLVLSSNVRNAVDSHVTPSRKFFALAEFARDGSLSRTCVRIWWNWQTRYFEVVVEQSVQVQVLLCAPSFFRTVTSGISSSRRHVQIANSFRSARTARVKAFLPVLQPGVFRN